MEKPVAVKCEVLRAHLWRGMMMARVIRLGHMLAAQGRQGETWVLPGRCREAPGSEMASQLH